MQKQNILDNVKEKWNGVSPKTKKLGGMIVVGTIVIALAAVLLLKIAEGGYSTLFTGLNQEEAQEVAAFLQEEGIGFKYDDKEGTIRVPEAQEEVLRAELLSKGYPKSGFTYDMRVNNSGIMTTESDRQQYTLYELQDRLGAQIRVFDGVSDAKVTIAQAEESRYALEDDSAQEASASVVVTMEQNAELTEKKAQAIKTLIAKAVNGMTFTNVSVFDAATMLEVGGSSEGTGTQGAEDTTALTSLIETNIEAKVRKVLEKIYGVGNVAVSVKGTLNMEKLISESTQYTVPEKNGDTDKVGLLEEEYVAGQSSMAGSSGRGVAGTDSNADTPGYTNEDNGNNGGNSDGESNRKWIYNTLKEQKEIDPGVLEDTTVGVVIQSSDSAVTDAQLEELIANSAGIALDVAGEKVTVVRVPANAEDEKADTTPAGSSIIGNVTSWLPFIIGGVVLLLALLVFLILRRRRNKDSEMPEELMKNYMASVGESSSPDDFPVQEKERGRIHHGFDSSEDLGDDGFSEDEEVFNLRMRRSLKLRENVGDFVDQNPQIAARMIQNWLREESGEK